MTSRRSSGSSRDESAVEPIRSQNITLSGRRSAVVSDTSGGLVGSGGAEDETWVGASAGRAWERNAAIASNRRRRWRMELTPMSLSSSAVSVGRTSASTSFVRNAASYCSSPRLLSHAPRSIAVSSDLAMLAVDYHAESHFCPGKETQTAGELHM